ncbi:unnamed protein product [Ectocarpus sp. 4 AP-2014]
MLHSERFVTRPKGTSIVPFQDRITVGIKHANGRRTSSTDQHYSGVIRFGMHNSGKTCQLLLRPKSVRKPMFQTRWPLYVHRFWPQPRVTNSSHILPSIHRSELQTKVDTYEIVNSPPSLRQHVPRHKQYYPIHPIFRRNRKNQRTKCNRLTSSLHQRLPKHKCIQSIYPSKIRAPSEIRGRI